MAILVPPAVFGEVKTVFDSPVISDVAKNVIGRNKIRVQARDEVTRVLKHDGALVGRELTIDAHDDFTIGQLEYFADVIGVI